MHLRLYLSVGREQPKAEFGGLIPAKGYNPFGERHTERFKWAVEVEQSNTREWNLTCILYLQQPHRLCCGCWQADEVCAAGWHVQHSIQQRSREHGEEASLKQRGNSPLTWQQAVDVSMMATTGAKAGAMHTAMTNVVAQKIEEAGEEPLAYKLPEGGIQGVRT